MKQNLDLPTPIALVSCSFVFPLRYLLIYLFGVCGVCACLWTRAHGDAEVRGGCQGARVLLSHSAVFLLTGSLPNPGARPVASKLLAALLFLPVLDYRQVGQSQLVYRCWITDRRAVPSLSKGAGLQAGGPFPACL